MKKNTILNLVVLSGALTLTGCYIIPINPNAHKVRIAYNQPDNRQCEFKADIVGRSGGAFGDLVTDADLIMYAQNDLKNKAAHVGANTVHIVAAPTGTAMQFGNLTTTIMAQAYLCNQNKQLNPVIHTVIEK